MTTKRAWEKQIRRVQKVHQVSRYDAMALIKAEAERIRDAQALVEREVNVVLHRRGLGMSRGRFMESPAGTRPDGSARFDWGRLISYCGLGHERAQLNRDGAPMGDGLFSAMIHAQQTGLFDRPCSIGERMRRCVACGNGFAGRNGALTCSAKCRKRRERKSMKAKDVTLSAKG